MNRVPWGMEAEKVKEAWGYILRRASFTLTRKQEGTSYSCVEESLKGFSVAADKISTRLREDKISTSRFSTTRC